MDNPCSVCADYPYWCRGICIDKSRYILEIKEDVEAVRKMEFSKRKKKLKVDTNKNGIRREAR